jgi:hypothetical protein
VGSIGISIFNTEATQAGIGSGLIVLRGWITQPVIEATGAAREAY